MYPETAEVPSVTLVLLQSIVPSDPALAVGVAVSTVTTTVSATLEHPVDAFVTVKLYVVVESGDAVGCATLVADKPVDGDHA